MARFFRLNGRKPYGTSTSRGRHDHARYPSSNTAIASFARGAEPGAGDQVEDSREVAETGAVKDLKTGQSLLIQRPGPRPKRRWLWRSAPHAAAARRPPLRPAAVDPALDALSAAPMPPAARHLTVTRYRGRQAEAAALQALPHHFFYMDIAKCRPPRASCTCSLASTAPASSRSPGWNSPATGTPPCRAICAST